MTYEELGELLKKKGNVVAYVYPHEGLRREYLFEFSPSNIANFIMKHWRARQIILTDILDNKILNTIGCFIDHCPDKNLLQQVLEYLIPLQKFEKKPQDFPVATMEEANDFALMLEAQEEIASALTFRLVSPLNISVFNPEKGEYDHTLMPERNPAYADEINRAIGQSLADETPGKLMDYWCGSEAVRKKIISLRPYVEFIGGEHMGVCDVISAAKLKPCEMDEIKRYLSAQYGHGWGEVFERHAVKTSDGELHISFWNPENFDIQEEPTNHTRDHSSARPKHRDPQR